MSVAELQHLPELASECARIGVTLCMSDRLEEAEAAFRKAVKLDAAEIDAAFSLGVLLKRKGKTTESLDYFRRSLPIDSTRMLHPQSLGVALAALGRADDAMEAFLVALSLDHSSVESAVGVGNLLTGSGYDNAIAGFRRAIKTAPENAVLHFCLAGALLILGHLEEGFREYEWLSKMPRRIRTTEHFAQPSWDGSPLDGRRILIHTEGGFGDSIQFARYLAMVADRGGKIIIRCYKQLRRLFTSMRSDYEFWCDKIPVPQFDCWICMQRLPRVFGTTLATIPADVPYLSATAENAETWRLRLTKCTAKLKVGIVWAGNPTYSNDSRRSIELKTFAPFAQVPDVCFFSLQVGDASAQSQLPPPGMNLIDWTAELHDFADTAGLIANLDLVISVDTATAHLAGAMGKQVWLMPPTGSEWRWMLDREDSPWYPTMRLFRQATPGDWDGVISRIADELTRLARSAA